MMGYGGVNEETPEYVAPPPHTDPDRKPTREGLEPHQVWVWLEGATPPHWAIRGTGLVVER